MIPIFGCKKGGNTVLQLDDRAVWTDQHPTNIVSAGGTTYTARLVTAPNLIGPAQEFGFLGRVQQFVDQTSGVTLTITPIIDGVTSAQAITIAKGVGAAPETVFPFHASGTQWQLQIDISGFTSEVQLGRALVMLIPRRSGV